MRRLLAAPRGSARRLRRRSSGDTVGRAGPQGPRRPGDRDAALLRLRRHGHRRDARPVSRRQNPDLDLKTASFNSNKAAAAKLAGGFEADVVEVCADEMQPLLVRGLIRPLDPDGDHRLRPARASRTPHEIRDEAGKVLFVPASAGPHGLIVNTDEVDPEPIDSYTDLFDPAVRGPGGDRVDAADRDRRWRAMALGMDDPMDLSAGPDRRGQGVPARPPRPVPRLRRVRRLDGQPLQVGRGR